MLARLRVRFPLVDTTASTGLLASLLVPVAPIPTVDAAALLSLGKRAPALEVLALVDVASQLPRPSCVNACPQLAHATGLLAIAKAVAIPPAALFALAVALALPICTVRPSTLDLGPVRHKPLRLP